MGRLKTVFCWVVVIVGVIYGGSLCAPYMFPESTWAYTLRYNALNKYVVVDSKPHDCDWGKAPIGNKECHFERVLTVKQGDESTDHNTLVSVTWEKVTE